MDLEHLECLLDEVSEVCGLALGVVDLVAEVLVLDLEEVHHGENLSVVGDKSLTNGVRAGHESLENLKSDGNDIGVSGVEGSLDWNDELRNDGEHLGTTLL